MSAGKKSKNWIESRALLRQGVNTYLIVLPSTDPGTLWEFPGGPVERHESPETALRRLLRSQVGVEIDFFVGQPPFAHNFGTHAVTYRYYICGVRSGVAGPRECAETRWVLLGQLRDYSFDAPTQQVVDWLLEGDGPPRAREQ